MPNPSMWSVFHWMKVMATKKKKETKIKKKFCIVFREVREYLKFAAERLVLVLPEACCLLSGPWPASSLCWLLLSFSALSLSLHIWRQKFFPFWEHFLNPSQQVKSFHWNVRRENTEMEVVGGRVNGRLPACSSVAPATARSRDLRWASDPDLDSKEEDVNKVLLGLLLRAHRDLGFKASWDLLTAGVWWDWELEAPRLGRDGPPTATGPPRPAHSAPGVGVLPRLTHPGEAVPPRKSSHAFCNKKGA